MKAQTPNKRAGGACRYRRLAGLILLWLGISARFWAGDTVELQILSTTDTHAALFRGAEEDGRGGMLRLASLVRQERDAFGAERTLLVDCGDTIQGGFEAALSAGAPGEQFLLATKVDVWVPGNHDFEFGVVRLQAIMDQLGKAPLVANLALPGPDGTLRRPAAWRLFELQGIRIAVIGVTASYLDQWLWGDDVRGYVVESAEVAVARILPAVHQARPHLIILAAHQGWLPKETRDVNEIARLVKRFPEIGLVLGGHTHRVLPGERVGPRSWYVQSGFAADWLGRTRIRFDRESGAQLDVQSELLPVGANLPEDPDLQRRVRPPLAAARVAARTTVTTLATDLSGLGVAGPECPTSQLLGEALRWRGQTQVALHGKLTESSLRAGRVTERDLYWLVPYENAVVTARVTGEELAQIVAEQAESRDSGAFNALWGMDARPVDNGWRLSWPDGRPLLATDVVTITLNGYCAAGGGGRFPKLREILRRPAAQTTDSGVNTREAVAEFLRHHPSWAPVRTTPAP